MSEEIQAYQNVMEAFVTQEIELQLAKRTTLTGIDKDNFTQSNSNVNKLEVATFALNRLPCYYASCVEGIERQKRRIKEQRQLRKKISSIVSQGFAAIESNPLRQATPIKTHQRDTIEEAKKTLPRLDDELPKIELTWIVSFMEAFLTNVRNEQVSHQEVIKLYYLLYYYWEENK